MQQRSQRQDAEPNKPPKGIKLQTHTMDLEYLSHQAAALVRDINRCIG